MTLTKKARKFFEDEDLLKAKFGAYAKYVLPFYTEVIKNAPELSDEIIDRLFQIKTHIRCFDKSRGYTGVTKRELHGDKFYSSVVVMANDFTKRGAGNSQESVDYSHLENFYHELLHAIIGAKIGKCKSSKINLKPWRLSNNKNGKLFFARLGNVSIEYYKEIDGKQFLYRYNAFADMLEEGIVEDWATSLMKELGCEPEDIKKLELSSKVSYPLFTIFCGAWNATSDNQLRKEFLRGCGDNTRNSKGTKKFKDQLYDLTDALNYTIYEMNEHHPNEFNLTKILNEYNKTIKLCKRNYNANKMTPEQKEKYFAYLECLESGKPLYNAISRLCDKSYENELEELENKLVKPVLQSSSSRKSTVLERGSGI